MCSLLLSNGSITATLKQAPTGSFSTQVTARWTARRLRGSVPAWADCGANQLPEACGGRLVAALGLDSRYQWRWFILLVGWRCKRVEPLSLRGLALDGGQTASAKWQARPNGVCEKRSSTVREDPVIDSVSEHEQLTCRGMQNVSLPTPALHHEFVSLGWEHCAVGPWSLEGALQAFAVLDHLTGIQNCITILTHCADIAK